MQRWFFNGIGANERCLHLDGVLEGSSAEKYSLDITIIDEVVQEVENP